MHWENHPFVLLLLTAAAAAVVFALISWRRRRSPGAVPLVVLSLAAGVWQAGYALELLADGQPNKVFWAQTQYPGIAVIPTAWLAVALQYSGRGSWLTRRNLALLSIMPLATIVLAWTNGYHGLIWSEITVDASSSLTVLMLDHGAFFWGNVIYSYIILLVGIVLVTEGLFQSERRYWAQAAALIVAAVIPWMANWLFGLGLYSATTFNLTPPAFALSAMVLMWAVVQAEFLDIVPIARQLVIDSMNNGVVVVDPMGRVIETNPPARRILEQVRRTASGGLLGQLPADGQVINQISQKAEGGYWELALGDAGDRRHYEVEILPILDNAGRLAGRLFLFNDATERKHREEERQRLEVRALAQSKMATLGEVAAGMAHEIHQPLSYITAMIQSMKEEAEMKAPDREEMRIRLSGSLRQIDRITNIVDRLRVFSRSDEAEMRPLHVGAVLDSAHLILGVRLRGENIGYHQLFGDDVPVVRANASQLEQVFINLLQNAIDALEDRALKDREENPAIRVETRFLPESGKVRISVADNGAGILPEHMGSIYNPFFTTKEVGKGTGLGLSIAYGIIMDHGGDISCKSEVGRGTEMLIDLPAYTGPAAEGI